MHIRCDIHMLLYDSLFLVGRNADSEFEDTGFYGEHHHGLHGPTLYTPNGTSCCLSVCYALSLYDAIICVCMCVVLTLFQTSSRMRTPLVRVATTWSAWLTSVAERSCLVAHQPQLLLVPP